jgi:peptide/nickel transport system substrate-binding protein
VPDAIDLNEMYPYRPDDAKRLLKEVGYDENTPLKFTILTGKQDAAMAEVAAMIKNQMAKIGVEATVNPVDQTTFGDRVLVKHDFEMAVNKWAYLIDINQASVRFFKGVPSDDMRIDDPPLQAMLHQWRWTLDPEGRKRISAGIQRRLADQLVWVSLTTAPFFQAYRNHVKNYPFYNQAYLLLATTWLEH